MSDVRRERSRLALLVLFGLAVGLALSELAARAFWTAPWYDRLAEEQAHQPAIYRMNEQGLRDRDYGAKPAGRKRVLLLGDSFTHGLGVRDETKIFPEILERRLNEMARFPGGVDVLNGGKPGSLTNAWRGLHRWAVTGFEPDVVVVVFFLRDGTTLGSNPDFFRPIRREIALRNRDSPLYRASYLYRILRDRQDRRIVGERYSKSLVDAYLGDETETEEWQRAALNILAIRKRTRRNGTRLGFVIFPILAELHETYPFEPVTDLLVEFARDGLQVPYLNLLDAFRGLDAPDLWVSPMNQHPNESGHAIAAEALLPFVVELLEGEPEA